MKVKTLLCINVFVLCLSSCGVSMEKSTPETQKLLSNLQLMSSRGIMFGHHDDTVYGIGWEGDEGRSDVKSVCGDYPAVISFDLGEIELGKDENLDKVSFDKIRKEIINQYERGGMVSLSWHARNPLTGGDAWDISDTTVVRSILPGGSRHDKFINWMDCVATFLNSLKDPEGIKVPVLFRPWHEHTGSWFWWGEKLCSSADYKKLWRMTVESLKAKGVNNVLYAYSSSSNLQDSCQYLERYPGDDLIDVMGFDAYQADSLSFVKDMKSSLNILGEIGKKHNKMIAVTETGYESVPDAKWWTDTLLPLIKGFPLSYVLVWRNARERPTHYYAPYLGQVSAGNFVEFYNDSRTLFVSNVNLYE